MSEPFSRSRQAWWSRPSVVCRSHRRQQLVYSVYGSDGEQCASGVRTLGHGEKKAVIEAVLRLAMRDSR